VILLDTNLLARLTSTTHPHGPIARTAIHRLLSNSQQIVIVPQNLYEFWVVATRNPGPRPAGENGLGLSPAQANQWLNFFRRRFTFLPDQEELPRRWQELVSALGVKGFRAHDARLAAAMLSYGISQLLTVNGADFKVMPITVMDLTSVA